MSNSRFDRRNVLKTALALAATGYTAFGLTGRAIAEDKILRIGFQKFGTFALLKARGTLDKAVEPLGAKVTWTEFPAGPQLLEALNAGVIDFGTTGEAPPIFAQAAGAPLAYIGHEPPAPKGEAILIPKGSTIKSVADLKGKKIALNKGSNVHYFLVKALEKAGVAYADIQPTFLAPADARAAFEKGAVDAWAIWDPFFAAAEASLGSTVLTDGEGLVDNIEFFLANKNYATANPNVVAVLLKHLAELDIWATANQDAAAELLATSIGQPKEVLKTVLTRHGFGVQPVGDEVIAKQQKIADTFLALGLIPKAIKVSDAQWKTPV
ncbi:MAG: sulfonate ABC transporter substrate-binding protein [Pseudomonadota bacterium]|nr:sulfonate ABC transporter substrate-binding protein [Pseudomonadota bacterium]